MSKEHELGASSLNKLERSIERSRGRLCVGVDVNKKMRVENSWGGILETMSVYLEQSIDEAAAVKIQLSGWLAGGSEGIKSLEEMVRFIRAVNSDVPIILDGKFSDIAVSSEHYAEFAFDFLGVEAITASPFLGHDAVKPLIEKEGKFVYFLANTSNKDAQTFLGWPSDDPLYLRVTREVESWNILGNLGLVVGGTDLNSAGKIRENSSLPFLIPGVGAQAADIDGVAHLLSLGKLDIVNVSRGLMESVDVSKAAVEYKQLLTPGVSEFKEEDKKQLISKLEMIGCVNRGDFVLQSGEKSSVYIDVRQLVSSPSLLKEISRDLLREVDDLDFDLLACIPTGGMPLATVMSQECGRGFVYVRSESKGYGMGKLIEGSKDINGKRVLLVDDVVTSGKSKEKAIESLMEAGAVIAGIVVVVDRRDTRDDILGIKVKSLLTLSQITGK